ncbi:MAG: lipopolysaccharide biosynthesis protein [Pseudomonadota bacterium]
MLLLCRVGWAVPTAVLLDKSDGAKLLEQRVYLDSKFTRAEMDQARLIWVIGAELDTEQWQTILSRVRTGAGLVLVPGEKLPDLSSLGLQVVGERTDRKSLIVNQSTRGALANQVVWSTAPQVGSRWVIKTLPGSPLKIEVSEQDTDNGAVFSGRLGRGWIVLFSPQLIHHSCRDFVLWPYFNYLMYVLACQAVHQSPLPFAQWEHAPVPGPSAMTVLTPILGFAWLLTLFLFFRARQYSRKHPEILDKFFVSVEKQKPNAVNWRSIGFTRPLAGFLTLVAILFLLFAPYYWLTNVLLPNEVQPFPQAKGIWDFVWEALQVAWFFFDAGTFVAFVKFFAEFRVKDPKEAIRSAQFFVWWQILTGLVQLSLACVAAVVVLPHTRYGYSSNFVILVALGQYPGFFGVITFFFQAYQRFDYNIGLDLLSDWVLRFVLQVPFVLLFRAWGRANPEYGEALGAALGIGVGFYVSSVVSFLLGVALYRRLGLRLLPLFLAHFDLSTTKRMLWYGLRVVLGKVFFRAAKTIEKVVISLLLINYTEWLGLESQIHYNLMFLFPIAYRFFETAMASLSESYGNGKKILTQYYLVRFVQVGSIYTAIGVSLMLALGSLFVQHAMDPQWARAADYLALAAVAGGFSAVAWLSDMLQKAAGRPGLFAVILGLEQGLRIGLFWLLIPRWQFYGFYMALLVGIIIKVVLAWTVNHRLIVRLRIFPWQMFIAPALAGFANYAILKMGAAFLGLSGRIEVMIVFFLAALLSFLICFFCCGLFGGFDTKLTEELEQASKMTGPIRPLTSLLFLAAKAGWTLSPIHNRFPVTIAPAAMEECLELELQRDSVLRS